MKEAIQALRDLKAIAPQLSATALFDIADWALEIRGLEALVAVARNDRMVAPEQEQSPEPVAAVEAVAAAVVPSVSVVPDKPVVPLAERGLVRGAAWSEADLEQLKKSVRAGAPWADVAKNLGRTLQACRARAIKEGWRRSAATVRSSIPAAKSQAAAAVRPAPSPRIVDELCARLDRLPYHEGMDAAADLKLVTGLLSGQSAVVLAQELPMSAPDLAARFRLMLPARLKDPRGNISIEGRNLLMAAAKKNAEADRDEG